MSVSVAAMKAMLERLDTEGVAPAAAMEQVLRAFPGATFEQASRAVEAVVADKHERLDEATAIQAVYQQIGERMSALPCNTTVGDAMRALADQGDEFARSIADWLGSREYRVQQALAAAAADAHPEWERVGIGMRRKGGPRTPEALVEWFQKNHPREARAIEEAELT